ncbi:MAG TPA: hypothetical protein VK821_05775 [Dehalococcoidia bacterium]|nr:hypothetical protein [Dehalococcoidia bacterium]
MFGMPSWRDSSPGLVVGSSDLVLAGAAPAEHSAFVMLQRWTAYNGTHAEMATNRDDADRFLSREESIGWAIYAPPSAHVNEAYAAVDEENLPSALEKVGRDVDEWLALLTRYEVSRIGIISLYDPLSVAELSAPAEQARMARVVGALNGLLHEYARKYDAEILDIAEVLSGRSGEFTRAIQGTPYLNNLGHVVLLGRIKGWLLEGKAALLGAVQAEQLFDLAINLRGR